MTLQECKLAFFAGVAALAQSHETSLSLTRTHIHTHADQAKMLQQTSISCTFLPMKVQKWYCDVFKQRRSSLLLFFLRVSVPLPPSACFLNVSWGIQIRPHSNVWHEMRLWSPACFKGYTATTCVKSSNKEEINLGCQIKAVVRLRLLC